MEKPFPIKTQIKLIKRAHLILSRQRVQGLCAALKQATIEHIYLKWSIYMERSKLSELFPLFTRENAINLFNEKNDEYKKPSLVNAYWWPINDYDSRLIFLEWMLKELKKSQPPTLWQRCKKRLLNFINKLQWSS
jgi:hypothetical protein